MTDRINGFYVTLDEDIREDDVEHLINAIRLLKHVCAVEKKIVNYSDWVGHERIKTDYLHKIIEIFNGY